HSREIDARRDDNRKGTSAWLSPGRPDYDCSGPVKRWIAHVETVAGNEGRHGLQEERGHTVSDGTLLRRHDADLAVPRPFEIEAIRLEAHRDPQTFSVCLIGQVLDGKTPSLVRSRSCFASYPKASSTTSSTLSPGPIMATACQVSCWRPHPPGIGNGCAIRCGPPKVSPAEGNRVPPSTGTTRTRGASARGR